jgi:transcriptional regulator with XRE-family HTH domain
MRGAAAVTKGSTTTPSRGSTTGQRVRAIRTRADISQNTLAVRAGLHLGTVSALERGLTVSPETLAKVANALGVDLEALQ